MIKRRKTSDYWSKVPASRVLAEIADIIYPGGTVSEEERDALDLFEAITDLIDRAGFRPEV